MVAIDIPMPESCEKCNAVGQFRTHTEDGDVSLFFCPSGSDVTREDREDAFPYRPDWCPMIEVEEKEIQERTSHVSWETRKVYMKKERQRHESAPEDEKTV